MWKNLPLIFTFIIAILNNFAFTTTPSEWKGDELLPFQDASGHLIGTYSNLSLNERAVICEPGYYQCAGTSLCCSTLCGKICSSSTCCEGPCCGIYCCLPPSKCCGNNGCCLSGSTCCNGKGCCPNGFQCCGNGNCCSEYEYCNDGICLVGLTPSITITERVVVKIVQYIIKLQVSVLKLAKDNNYNDKEANKIDQSAKKLIDCVNNFGMSLVKAGLQKNDSCISCDQANILSYFNTNSTPSTNETLAMLKLFYSIEQAMVNATECKFSINCMSGDSCSQDSKITQTSGCNSNSVNNSFKVIGIFLILTIMNLYFVYGDALIGNIAVDADFY
ncbi:60_t:CDS:1 [Scutellospora calospora]|uniref:60_t:CDS:1 n=1 Tax=Scutellospora calospora TaxID=85575 RepID=A0ACA9LU61_9GLOM|nr:60_t:CDS:1 [Scutellospora calospora]